MKFCLNYNNKKFRIDVKVCNWFEKFLGLMFVRREKAKALLFDFEKPTKITIHSCFVFFPFIAVWLDDKNKIIDSRKIKPFTLYIGIKKSFFKLIEIPVNKKYRRMIEFLMPRR